MTNAHQQLFSFSHLRFSPDILRRLGEELNPNADQGILELVKNSHDADASSCTIELTHTGDKGGVVTIIDDGIGMDREAIERNWLLLGKSSKSPDRPTALGRVQVGNKGLGRLAALRLGTMATLISCPKHEPSVEYILSIDWDKYDSVESVEEVELEIKQRRRKERDGPGTTIRIEHLRQSIQRSDVKRLARGVLLLADPFADDPSGFRPRLVCEEFDDLVSLVERRYFDDAEFHLIADVDFKGKATAQVLDWKGNILYSATHDELRKKSKGDVYSCPPAKFDLWTFILDKETFSTRNSTQREVQEWLGEFGGVHLYLRGFRVAPYGNPGNDWLDLNLRRSRSPEGRPSTNTSIGRISVADPGEVLIQKTDRSGLIEDNAFEQLKAFAGEALDWMAKRRLEEREAKRSEEKKAVKTQASRAKEIVDSAIELLPKSVKGEIQDAFAKYANAREKEAVTFRNEVQLYRTLSTAGITAALFSHESKQPLDMIEKNIQLVQRSAKKIMGAEYETNLSRPVDRILSVAKSLRAFGNLTLSQIDKDKRRARRIEIHAVINEVGEMFGPFVDQRKAKLTLRLATSNPFLRTSSAAIESIVTNLIMNSLQAFEEAPPGKHLIELATSIENNYCTISCADTGPGIVDLKPRDIWLPGETTRIAGTGLGLTIVRDTVLDLGGTVEAIAHGILGGAELHISLPILGD